MNVKRMREDFPILSRKVNGHRLVYLDNAATSQKPRQMIDAISDYYRSSNANVHRGIYRLSEEATQAYENAHDAAAKFISADSYEEIVFTKNTTESLNLLSHSLKDGILRGDEILLSEMEHHSNLVPWQQLAREKGAVLRFIPVGSNGELKMQQLPELLSKKTKIVSVTHVSNVLGTVNDVKEMAKMAHERGALMIVDGAQSAPHMPVDVRKLGCDFLAFSAHKMLGPTGLGVLYGRKELLEKMPPFLFGGDMIREVSYEDASWNDLPWKFEAGTPNIAGAIGFAAAMKYLQKAGMENILGHEKKLAAYAMKKMEEVDGAAVYGPAAAKRGGVVSFNLGTIHPHDLSAVLDREGIAIRGGHHCAMPLTKRLGLDWSARASVYMYNGRDDIDALIAGMKKAAKLLEGKHGRPALPGASA